jgi:hypothetical protein
VLSGSVTRMPSECGLELDVQARRGDSKICLILIDYGGVGSICKADEDFTSIIANCSVNFFVFHGNTSYVKYVFPKRSRAGKF